MKRIIKGKINKEMTNKNRLVIDFPEILEGKFLEDNVLCGKIKIIERDQDYITYEFEDED